MFSKCANPDCGMPFDYRQGQFFRFPKNPEKVGLGANTHSVQHFWLCDECRACYFLEYREGCGVLIRTRSAAPRARENHRVIAAA
jgi:hypothetical protein